MFLNFKNIIVCAFFCLLSQLISNKVYSQVTDEIWPEIDGLYRINHEFRTMVTLSSTRQQSMNTDGSFAAYLDYFALPFIRKMKNHTDSSSGFYQWFRAGYSYGQSTASAEDEFKEHIIVLESNTRFHLPHQFLATVKNRFDTRVFNGTLKERFRPRVTIERDCKTEFMTCTVYAYGEYYFNFNSSSTNKARLCVGTEIWVSKLISFEVYYLGQFQNSSVGNDLTAAGICLKFNIDSKREKALKRNEKEQEERIRAK